MSQDTTPAVIDPELDEAKKSMGGRIDPDPTPEEPKTPEPAAPKEPEPTPAKEPEEPKAPEAKEPETVTVPPQAPVKRPERYIPMAQYHSEKREWEDKVKAAEEGKAAAEAKITELSAIAGQKDGAQKDDDILAFADKHGFDEETVNDLLKLAEKRVLTPDRIAAIEKFSNESLDKEINQSFETEFKEAGEPSLKKHFPTLDDAQLAKAKEYLDQIAHTKDNHDKPLPYLIFEHQEEIGKLFTEEEPEPGKTPQTKRTIESSRVGAGKPVSMSAKDFVGQNDFSALDTLEPAERSRIIKDFDDKTYTSWKSYVQSKENESLEVMRDGRKIILK